MLVMMTMIDSDNNGDDDGTDDNHDDDNDDSNDDNILFYYDLFACLFVATAQSILFRSDCQ